MKIFKGTLVGGIAFFLIGWLVWGVLLAGFSEESYNTAINRPDGAMIWWAMVLSNFVFAFFLTLVLNWAGAKGILAGLKIGAIFGSLYALSVDLGMFSMTTIFLRPAGIVVDTLAYAVVSALIGLLIVLLWGKD